jgi:hypothetical protein
MKVTLKENETTNTQGKKTLAISKIPKMIKIGQTKM